MGFAIIKGKYHKGPKKNTRKRAVHKPKFAPLKKPAVAVDTTTKTLAENDTLIKALSTMSGKDMARFIEATANPNPRGCVVAVPTSLLGGGFGGLGGCDLSGLGRSKGRARVVDDEAIVLAPSKTTAKEPPKTETSEKVIGQIVRKPNGEIVLRFF